MYIYKSKCDNNNGQDKNKNNQKGLIQFIIKSN